MLSVCFSSQVTVSEDGYERSLEGVAGVSAPTVLCPSHYLLLVHQLLILPLPKSCSQWVLFHMVAS